MLRWKLKEVEMTEQGNLVREGTAWKGDQTITVTVLPTLHDGELTFRLRSPEPDFGLDVKARFATEREAMDYAEHLASERPNKQDRQIASHATADEPSSRH